MALDSSVLRVYRLHVTIRSQKRPPKLYGSKRSLIKRSPQLPRNYRKKKIRKKGLRSLLYIAKHRPK